MAANVVLDLLNQAFAGITEDAQMPGEPEHDFAGGAMKRAGPVLESWLDGPIAAYVEEDDGQGKKDDDGDIAPGAPKPAKKRQRMATMPILSPAIGLNGQHAYWPEDQAGGLGQDDRA